jgi:hypothetical protein
VQLGDRAGLADLRGSAVEVTLDDGATKAGRVVGVEASLAPNQAPALVLQREADLQVIPLARSGRSPSGTSAAREAGLCDRLLDDLEASEEGRRAISSLRKLGMGVVYPGEPWITVL